VVPADIGVPVVGHDNTLLEWAVPQALISASATKVKVVVIVALQKCESLVCARVAPRAG